MDTPTSTTTALVLLALVAGGIWATMMAIVHVWISRQNSRQSSRGRHRRGAPRPARDRTAVLETSPGAAFPAADPDLTPALRDAAGWPTMIIKPVSDPWADTVVPDSVFVTT